MAETVAKNFINALNKLESDCDLETICSLFGDNCEIGNVVTEDKDISARDFWSNYRNSFDKVQSTFRNEIIMDGAVALEWKTTGTNGEGREFEYEGVSILETTNDKINRFHAYFDANKLGKQLVD